MARMEHNGEGFHYLVGYRRLDDDNAEEMKQKVADWHLSELVIPNQETFKEYEIYVQAANNEGLASINTVERRKGFSGQDGESSYCFRMI